jgi:hypothetical protein
MTRLALALALAAALAGCGVGAGEPSEGEGVSVVVSRDFGARTLNTAEADSIPAGETVMRFLQREFDVTTRYGGGFVQSIEGLSGGSDQGRRTDWFFYVNGIESSEGAAARKLVPGDRVWWDRHDWRVAQRVPAVVGSFPEPFLSGLDGKRFPLALVCAGEERACDEVTERFGDAGVEQVSRTGIGVGAGRDVLRVLVGPWSEIRQDPAARQLESGPGASGVYARPAEDAIELLDARGRVTLTLRGAGGLVAATRFQDQQATWVVTGIDDAGVAAAAAALREDLLENHFAIAVEAGRPVPLPVDPQR